MLIGLALTGMSLYVFLDDDTFGPVTQDVTAYNYVLYFFMVAGGLMTLVGFLGCCGALQESQCMLATFFAFLLVLFAGQLFAVVWMVTKREDFQKTVTDTMKTFIQHKYGEDGKDDPKTRAFDRIQKDLKCCGINGPSDWARSKFNDVDEKPEIELGVTGLIQAYQVPESCCSVPKGIACEAARALKGPGVLTGAIYSEGCFNQLMVVMRDNMWILLCIGVIIGLLEILGMIFSMVLCCAVRRIDEFKA